MRPTLSIAGLLSILPLTPIVAPAQGPAAPSLPGARVSPPGWIGPEAPFDVSKFFEAPPIGQNAGPLYLDALFEFTPDVASCFPKGAVTDARAQEARDRVARRNTLTTDGERAQPEAIDALLSRYRSGFEKLAKAQRLPRCSFPSDITPTALLPHIQATREVARVLAFKVRRELDRGEVDRAIDDVATTLRMSDDLRPRGPSISQLVGVALTSFCYHEMIRPILAAPRLTAPKAERLLRLLTEHEARARKSLGEGLRFGYLTSRATVQALAVSSKPRAGAAKRAAPKADQPPALAVKDLMAMAGLPADPSRVRAVEEAAAAMTPERERELVDRIGRFFAGLLKVADSPYLERRGKDKPLLAAFPEDRPLDQFIASLLSETWYLSEAVAREEATIRGAECQVALLLWQLTRGTPPRDLAAVAKAAGLATVPVDPYSGRAFRLATVQGRPAAYSVGTDLVDDKGQKDWDSGRRPGDFIFPLPAPSRPGAGRPSVPRAGRGA